MERAAASLLKCGVVDLLGQQGAMADLLVLQWISAGPAVGKG